MALKYRKNCAVCKAMKKDEKLKRRIYNSSYFDPSSPESLNALADDYVGLFSRASLYNHVRKHGIITPSAAKYRKDKIIAAAKGDVIPLKGGDHINSAVEAVGKLVPQVMGDVIAGTPLAPDSLYEQSLDDIIIVGMDDFKKGKIKLNAATLLTAIKIKADIESKTKDRKADFVAAMAAIVAGGASGD